MTISKADVERKAKKAAKQRAQRITQMQARAYDNAILETICSEQELSDVADVAFKSVFSEVYNDAAYTFEALQSYL